MNFGGVRSVGLLMVKDLEALPRLEPVDPRCCCVMAGGDESEPKIGAGSRCTAP